MVCVALQEITVTCNVRCDNWWKIVASYQDGPRYQIPDKAVHMHTHTYTAHTIWWLVLGWVTTKEDHPLLPIEYYCIKCGSALAGMERVGGR